MLALKREKTVRPIAHKPDSRKDKPMQTPPLPKSSESTSVSLPTWLLELLDRHVERNGRNRSGIIATAIERTLILKRSSFKSWAMVLGARVVEERSALRKVEIDVPEWFAEQLREYCDELGYDEGKWMSIALQKYLLFKLNPSELWRELYHADK